MAVSCPCELLSVNAKALNFKFCIWSYFWTFQKKVIFQGATEVEKDTIDRLESAYNGLEIYLKKSRYIAGDDLTIADFSILPTLSAAMVCIFQTSIFGFNTYKVSYEINSKNWRK